MEEINPPWVQFPGFEPGDFFWRDAGQPWLVYVWRPYYDSLTPKEQEDYLRRWKVPKEWQDFYFDPEFQKWLEAIDEEDLD